MSWEVYAYDTRRGRYMVRRVHDDGGWEYLMTVDRTTKEFHTLREAEQAASDLNRYAGRRPRVYLCAAFARRAELCGYIPLFERAGFDVCSRWLTMAQHAALGVVTQEEYDRDPHADRMNELALDHQRAIAEMDLADLRSADMVVAFSEHPLTLARGGRHVEYGYALGAGKRVVVVGPPENRGFFYSLAEPHVAHVGDVYEAVVELSIPASPGLVKAVAVEAMRDTAGVIR